MHHPNTYQIYSSLEHGHSELLGPLRARNNSVLLLYKHVVLIYVKRMKGNGGIDVLIVCDDERNNVGEHC